ncbi:MAG: hypothetical protein SV775_18810 [Thermodesulfobacteriota bacterium]|nr:hypothetical protein [Thermodesulfobacteriota bacterium]
MLCLSTIGVIGVCFGILCLSSPKVLERMGAVLNKPVLFLDEKLYRFHVFVGLLLAVIGGWLILVAFRYPDLWYLYLVGILALVLGLGYLFFAGWLAKFSNGADVVVLSTDEKLLKVRKVVGFISIVASIYILYVARLMSAG